MDSLEDHILELTHNVQERCEKWLQALREADVVVIQDLEVKGIEQFDQLVRTCQYKLEMLAFLWRRGIFTHNDLITRNINFDGFERLFQFVMTCEEPGLLGELWRLRIFTAEDVKKKSNGDFESFQELFNFVLAFGEQEKLLFILWRRNIWTTADLANYEGGFEGFKALCYFILPYGGTKLLIALWIHNIFTTSGLGKYEGGFEGFKALYNFIVPRGGVEVLIALLRHNIFTTSGLGKYEGGFEGFKALYNFIVPHGGVELIIVLLRHNIFTAADLNKMNGGFDSFKKIVEFIIPIGGSSLLAYLWGMNVFTLADLAARKGGIESFKQLFRLLCNDVESLIEFLNLRIGCTLEELEQVAQIEEKWVDALANVKNALLLTSLHVWYSETFIASESADIRVTKKWKMEICPEEIKKFRGKYLFGWDDEISICFPSPPPYERLRHAVEFASWPTRSNFEYIRFSSIPYIDKTDIIYELTRKGHVFLTRPRRFGKTLLISTLKQLYLGSKDCFENLKIYKKMELGEEKVSRSKFGL